MTAAVATKSPPSSRAASDNVGFAGWVFALALTVTWFGDPQIPGVPVGIGALLTVAACALLAFEEWTYRLPGGGRSQLTAWTRLLVLPLIAFCALSAAASGFGPNLSDVSLRLLWFLLVVPSTAVFCRRSPVLVKWIIFLLASRSVVGIAWFLIVGGGPRLQIIELGGDNILAQAWVIALVSIVLLTRRGLRLTPRSMLALWPIAVVTVLLTSSRGGLILLVLSALLLIAVKSGRGRGRSRLKLVLGLTATALVGYFLVLAVAPDTLSRFEMLTPGAGAGDNARSAIVREAWTGSIESPWLGNGPGAVDFENPAAVRQWNSTGRTISAHNSFLQISYDLGVPFAIYFWLAFLWLVAGTSPKRWAYLLPFLAAAVLETGFLVLNVAPILGLYVHAISASRWQQSIFRSTPSKSAVAPAATASVGGLTPERKDIRSERALDILLR